MAIATEVFANENRTIEREMTAEELADIDAMREKNEANKAANDAQAAQKVADRQAVLIRLGMTAEEAELFL
jgi:hypothetical protein